jgi:hypothetical protein
VIEERPTRLVSVKNDTRSPVNTGCLNSTLSIETVTTLEGCQRCASIAAAKSISDKITPPKIVPSAFVSRGIIKRRMAGILSFG